MNLYRRLFAGFCDALDAGFLVQPGTEAVTYAQMDQRSAVFAACLDHAGVARGQRLLVQVNKSADAVALYLAALRVGAVYVPLNPAYTASEVQYFLQDAEPALFICNPARRQELQAVMAECATALHTLGDDNSGSLARLAATLQPLKSVADVADDDACAMLYTSGTTGRSKGAVLSVGNLRSNAEALHAIWQFESADVLLHALPIFHVHGLFVALHCALLSGCRVLFLPRFEVAGVRHALPDTTVMMGVPTFYQRLLADPEFSASDCHNVRLFISGSAPLSPAVFHDFEARTGHRVLERYGMTETGMIAANPLGGNRVPGSVGFALPGVGLRLAGDSGEAARGGETGSVEVNGPGVFSGYWNQPQKTADSFSDDGWFKTGDAGCLDSEGRLFLKGRDSDLIISGGFNIYPAEIEQAIDALPGVTESAVIGSQHNDLGEAVVAVIAGEVAFTSAAELAELLQQKLARFKLPRRVYIVSALPRNAMGKVQKNALREQYQQAFPTPN